MRARVVAMASGLLLIAGLLVWLLPGESEPARPAARKPRREMPAPTPVAAPVAPDLPHVETPRPETPAPPAPHIAGFVVRQSDGSTLAGAQLTLLDLPPGGRDRVLGITHTDADGKFDLPVDAPTEHAVLGITWQPVARWLEAGHEIEEPLRGGPVEASLPLKAADFTTGVPRRIELDTGWLIGGSVETGHGFALHGARLAVDGLGCTAESGELGEFRLRDVRAGAASVTVSVSAPGHVTRRLEVAPPPPGTFRSGLDVVLPEAVSVRGVIAHERGVPFADVEVMLLGEDEVGPGTFVTRTQPDGAFALEGLPEGRFDLVVRIDDERAQLAGAPEATAETWVRGLELAGEEPRELRVAIEDGQRLRGSVLDEAGRPLANHLVVARAARAPPCDPAAWSPVSSTETDSRGAFELRRLQPGPWELTVEGLPAGCEHGDGFHWLPLGVGEGPAPLAQLGPRPGSPRPVECVREVQLEHVPVDVELVVKRPKVTPSDGSGWPALEGRIVHGHGYPAVGALLEVLAGPSRRASASMKGWMGVSLVMTDGCAAGLLRFTDRDCVPHVRVLHDAQLEAGFGEVELAQSPAIEVRVTDEVSGERIADAELAMHWRAGARPERVVIRDVDRYEPLYADRETGLWELTVSAPGYRRWRQAGIVPKAREKLGVQVGLRRW